VPRLCQRRSARRKSFQLRRSEALALIAHLFNVANRTTGNIPNNNIPAIRYRF
jgi:hypothetical protein